MPRARPAARLLPTIVLLLALAAAFGTSAPADPEPGGLEAGLAVVDLTPEGPVPLGGYAARHGRPSTGVHDPIEARALVLREGGASVAIVALDLVGVSRSLVDLVRERVSDLGLGDVVILATHTHAGPGALSEVPLWRPAMGRFDPALFRRTAARVESAVRRAYADLAPARVSWTRTEGLPVRNRAFPDGPVDPTVGVLAIESPGGALRAVVVHAAAHPTILGSDVTALSAGWPGALRREIERRRPGTVAIFWNGAMGDVSPVAPDDAGRDPFDRAEAFGRTVADVALRALGAPADRPAPSAGSGATRGGALRVLGTREVHAPTVASRLLGSDEDPLAPSATFALPVSRLEIAGLHLVTVPGEPTFAVGRRLGQGRSTWVLACAGDHLGYFVSRAGFYRGGYEADLSLFGPDAADRLAAAAAGEDAEADPTGGGPGGAGAPAAVPGAPVLIRAGADVPDDPPGLALGLAQGRRLRPQVRDLLRAAGGEIVDEVLGHGGGLALLPAFVATGLRPRDLVLPLLVLHARRLQRHVPPAYLAEMEGIARGAGVPYDAILLENLFLTLAEQPDKTSYLSLPARCTNVVALGDATSMGQLLHGSTLDWGLGEVLKPRVVTEVLVPAEGHPFVSVTWPGMVGALRAMGAQGIAVTEESCAAPDDTTRDGIPVNLLIRDVVQHAGSLGDAVRRAREGPGTCGYKITISDGRALDARVVEVTARHAEVRRPVGGLLLGVDPGAPPQAFEGPPDPTIPTSDGSSRRRYPAVRRVLEDRSTKIRLADVESALALEDGGVLNDGTLLAVVFEPELGRFHVARDAGVRPRGAGRGLTFADYDLADLLPPDVAARYAPPWTVTGPGDVTTRVVLDDFAGVRVERVELDSPVRSGDPGNDHFEADLFTPRAPRGAVIQLPHWKEARSAPGERLLALAFARHGYAVMLLPLPWQYDRAPEGVGSGALTLSRDLARTREAAFQGAADAKRASLWLESARGFPPDRQAILGISLGGHVASLALGAYPDRFAAGVFLLASSHPGGALFRPNGVTDRITRELLRRGVGPEEARDLLGPIDPAALARPDLADRVLLVAGDSDPVAPQSGVEALAKAWGGARVAWYPGGHQDVIRHLLSVYEEVARHLDRRLGAP